MRRQLIWFVVIVLAASALVAALRTWQVSRTERVEEERRTAALPYDISSRGVPSPGSETLVLAPEIGAVAQLTVDGDWREIVGYCSQLNAAAEFLMCRATGMSDATYLRLTRYQFDDDTTVTLTAGYFGTVDANAVLSQTDFDIRATQPFALATDVANTRQQQRATVQANAEFALATQTAVVVQATTYPDPTAQNEVDLLLGALDATATTSAERAATLQPPVGTPIPQPTVPTVLESPYTAVEALRQMLEDTSNRYQVGYFRVGTQDEAGYFYARAQDANAFVWQNGDWVYQASSTNRDALDYFVEVFPY